MTTLPRFIRGGATALLLVGATILCFSTAQAATITIVNNNAAGVGFNDPTPVAPVGGNPGATLGDQRLFVFQTAANQWGGMVQSSVPVLVRAQFSALTCTATSAVLGSTGVVTIHANFSGAPLINTWYPQSLANSLSGTDLSAANPDMQTSFNLTLDGGTCLGGQRWYYGIDGNEGTNIELLAVVLHELAHGLGFSTTTSGSSGNFNGGLPNVYDHYLLDNLTGLHWDQETPVQRQASAVATNKLVWDGSAADVFAAGYLGHRPEFLVNAPAGIAGEYTMVGAAFGAPVTAGGVTGNVVLVDDGTGTTSDACEALVNAGAVAGNFALLDRGTCTFVVKAQQAQAAGAIGVIVGNNAAGLPPNPLGGTDPTITIPVIGISQADANTLKANLGSGVNVTLNLHPTEKAGADLAGHPLMYTPTAFASGSSISHWDVSVTPNALMEPFINSDLHNSVDMTLPLLRDIGWLDLPTPALLAEFTAESQGDGVLLRWQFSSTAAVRIVTVERSTSENGVFTAVPAQASSDGDFTLALDKTAEPGVTYWYRLAVLNPAGGTDHFGLVAARRNAPLAGDVYLGSPSPNPTTGAVAFGFRLGRPEFVRLTVTDAGGRRVRTLHEGMMLAGEYNRSWDGRGENSGLVPAGVYFLSLRTSNGVRSQRVALMR